MALFQSSIIRKYTNMLDQSKVDAAWDKFRKHFLNPVIQDNIRNTKEEQYQEGFLDDLFVEVLGYVRNPKPKFNLTTEYKNEKDAKKADGAIIIEEKVLAVVELKGTDTTDLNKIEEQAFGYKNNQSNCIYVITSNFEKLRFYVDNAIEYLELNLFQLTRKDFELLYLILHYQQIKDGIPKKMKDESIVQEENITKQLYKDYSEFKQVLFANLCERNPEYDQLLVFNKTQKLLDRFLFVFFAEDRGLIPPYSVRRIVRDWNTLKELDVKIPLLDRFRQFFGYFNTGYKGKDFEIYAYNGGLFAPDEFLDTIEIDDELLYEHAVKIADYDFESDVDVNILGHIFENSLNEIDEIKARIAGEEIDKGKTKRKKDGVFYTPKYITKYIVENTLGKLCEEKKLALTIEEEEYISDKRRQRNTIKRLHDKLKSYREWLLTVTICDPACGSGAFLNQALEFLIAEHRYIDELQAKLFGDSIVLSDIENSILENNLYGVDLNEESVEIAKLSLWLRTAQPDRKLNNLNDNIKCGNSLIDDPEIAGAKAFNWEKEFPKVFEKGGFDVVIGNPPYVSVKEIPEIHKTFYIDKYQTSIGQFDLYTLFYEKAFNITREEGVVSYISPNTFISNQDYLTFRKFIIDKTEILEIINLGETVFQDANLDVSILTFKKHAKTNKTVKIIRNRKEFDSFNFDFLSQALFIDDDYEIKINLTLEERKIINKLYNDTVLLESILNLPRGIEFGSNSDKIFKEEKEGSYKIIFGRNIDRYNIDFDSNFCFFENNISIFKTLEIYTSKKLLIQRIRNLSLKRRIIATYDEDEFLCTNTLRIGLLKTEGFSLKYILAVINSTLINYLFLKQFLNKDIYTFQLKQIPIKFIETQQPFIDKADRMLSLNADLQALVSKFLSLLQSELGLEKPSKKLEAWFELDFSDFTKELTRMKIKLSLEQKSEWMDYFEKEKAKALAIRQEIDATDKEIDRMVYELYELTEDEIAIVEES